MRVDAGTSIALFAQAREDFHEQTAMEAVISFLQTYGRPRQMTFDRDPRWVGGSAGRDFPSPLRRLLLCLGIEPHICPPHRPDKNAYVERYHRAYGQECIQRYQPATLQEVTRPSLRRFSSIITGNVPIKVVPVAASLLVSRSPPYRPCLPFQQGLILIDGWRHSTSRCFCVASVGILGSMSICKPTTSIRDGQGARCSCR